PSRGRDLRFCRAHVLFECACAALGLEALFSNTSLIAEEVNKVYPDLVIRDEDGMIQGVRYDELPSLSCRGRARSCRHCTGSSRDSRSRAGSVEPAVSGRSLEIRTMKLIPLLACTLCGSQRRDTEPAVEPRIASTHCSRDGRPANRA